MNTLNNHFQLINDQLTPLEASNTVIPLIEETINNYKLQKLSLWIANHNVDTKHLDERIDMLTKQKQHLVQFISQAKKDGQKVRIGSEINVELVA